MNTHDAKMEAFWQLAAIASREEGPLPDVSAAVAKRVHAVRLARTRATRVLRPFVGRWVYAVAGACAAVAFTFGYLGLQAWSILYDPTTTWVSSNLLS